MSRVEIRGVIVPSNYDLEWTRQYIEKGIITPESVARRAIAAQPKDVPLEMYVNSPGGSVFAAYEIINALAAWRTETKQSVNITIGAMAASAASAIAVLSGAKLAVHRNSKLMFHGAWSETVGGAEAHEDTKTLLEQINADIKTQLVSRYGIAPETVNEWFAEGRMGWLTAADAIKYGMASSVLDADDADQDFADADVSAMGAQGLNIAALLPKMQAQDAPPADEPKQEAPDASDKPADTPANQGGTEQPSPAPDAPPAPAARDIDAEVRERVAIEIGNALADHIKQLNDLAGKLDTKEQERRKVQSAHDAAVAAHAKEIKHFETRLAETQTALEQANARLVKLTLGSLSYSPAIETWAEAMAACDGDYAKARKQYPDAYAEFMHQNNKRK